MGPVPAHDTLAISAKLDLFSSPITENVIVTGLNMPVVLVAPSPQLWPDSTLKLPPLQHGVAGHRKPGMPYGFDRPRPSRTSRVKTNL